MKNQSINRVVVLSSLLTAALTFTLGLLSTMTTRAQSQVTISTNVSGTIVTDTVWTAVNSPYILTDIVDIAPGVTLTIEPGVKVMGQLYTGLYVNGHLQAAGLVTKPITFTSAIDSSPGQWDGMGASNQGSFYLNHVVIRYGRPNLGLSGTSGNQRIIQNSTITGSFDYPIIVSVDAIHRLQMSNVTFSGNNPNRILIYGSGGIGTLAGNTTLTDQPGLVGYEISNNTDPFWISAGITLTLEPGVTLFAPDRGTFYLMIDGHLEATGTISNPVTFTSTSDSGPGDWGILKINDGGTAHLNHAIVRQADFNIGLEGSSGGSVLIENSIITASARYAMLVDINALHRLKLSNVTFSNIAIPRIILDTYSTYTMTGDAVLSAQSGLEGYEVYGDSIVAGGLIVPSGITLTLEPAVSLFMPNNGQVQVHGYLETNGTLSNPVTITSKLDSAPGQWGGLVFGDGIQGGNGRLDYATIRYANGNITINNPISKGQVLIDNSRIINASSNGLTVQNGQLTAVCSSFANNLGDGVNIASSGTPTVTIFSSSIINNVGEGVNNDNSALVNARYNWWGDSSGPSGIGPGIGDSITGMVSYTPWLMMAPRCKTWAGNGTSNNWSESVNWYPAGVPAGADVVFLNNTSSTTVTLDTNGSVNHLLITGDGINFSQGDNLLAIGGDYRQLSGSFTAVDGVMTLQGNFSHAGGSFNQNNGTVIFSGSVPQFIIGHAATTFGNVIVSSGVTLNWPINITISGILTNQGNLIQSQDISGNGDVTFLDSGGYGGVIINANDPGDGSKDLGSTTVTIKGNQDCTTVPGETVRRCFNINPANATGRDATITFYFHSSELSGNNCSTLQAYHLNSSGWQLLTLGRRSCAGDPFSLQVINVADFSPFVLRSGGVPTATNLQMFGGQPAGVVRNVTPFLILFLLALILTGLTFRGKNERKS